MNKSNRYKKRGWHGESYRHYLAAKGVKTAFDPIKSGYFNRAGIRDDLKGRRMSSALAEMTSSGFKVDDIKRNPSVARAFEEKHEQEPGSVFREITMRQRRQQSMPTRAELFGSRFSRTDETSFDDVVTPLPMAQVPVQASSDFDVFTPGMVMTGAQDVQEQTSPSQEPFQFAPTSVQTAGQVMTPSTPERTPLEAEL